MDKVGSLRNKVLFLLGIFILALAFSAAMPDAEAGVSMAPPPPPADKLGPGEHYAESRFGRPPAQVDTGVGQSYVAREVENMEISDEADVVPGRAAGSRAPAGLEYGKGASSTRSTEAKFRSGLSEPTATLETSSAVARKGVQEVALIASDLGYFPRTVFVSRDVPVRLFVTGSSKNTLCIMMDSFSVRKQVRSQKIEEITFTPNVPGKYRFYCPVNGMEGTMVVKEFASAAPADDAISSRASAPERQPGSVDENEITPSTPTSVFRGAAPGVRE